jgi:nicotinamidase-related amidase
MSEALIIVDIQNDYFPGGAMELVGSEAAAAVATKVKADFSSNNLPIFIVQHIATSPSATFFLPNTHGVEIHPSVTPNENDVVVVKHFPNSFRETNLLELLREKSISKLTVIGMMTHMCIDTTVRAASDLGFEVTVVADACATRNLRLGDREVVAKDVQTAYLAALDGTFAIVI